MNLPSWIPPELLALITILAASVLIVRAGAIALKKTGLSWEASLFQSQSAFMGVGFTTSEAETVVTHAVRRKIIRLLMLLGFGSIIGTLSTTVVTFATKESHPISFGVLFAFLVLFWLGWKIQALERVLDAIITRALERVTTLHTLDFEGVLNLDKGYSIAIVHADETDCWLASRTLRELELAEEGVLVLSITRDDGTVLATPTSRVTVRLGDKLLCYGLEDVLEQLAERKCGELGDAEHDAAKRSQRARVSEEKAVDAQHSEPVASA